MGDHMSDDTSTEASELAAQGSNEQSQSVAPSPQPSTDPVQLPDDHPLVKAYNAQKATISDLKSKVTAQRTDADRIADLEQQAASFQRDALRLRVAGKHGISEEDAELFLTGSDEESLTRQAQRLAEHAAKAKPPTGAYVPQSGHQPSAPALNSDELENALRRKLGIH